jgi:hypothetical protein
MFKDKIKLNALNFYHNKNEIYIKIINEDIETLNKYVIGVKEFKYLTWDEKLAQVKEYILKNCKLPPHNSKDKNIMKLATWLNHQKERIYKNEENKKKFNEFLQKYKEFFKTNEEIWFNNLKEVEEYILNNYKLPPYNSKDKNIIKISNWINTQKKTYKNK